MVENPIVMPRFKPFSTHVTLSLSKISFTVMALILKLLLECTRFRTFLTPRSIDLLEKLIVIQKIKKFPAFDVTRRFNTIFTTTRHWSLS